MKLCRIRSIQTESRSKLGTGIEELKPESDWISFPIICLIISDSIRIRLIESNYQALHSVSMRPDVCSVRVCETSLSVLELLLDLGVVSCDTADGGSRSDDPAWKPTSADSVDDSLLAKSHGICIDIVSR